MNEGENLSIPHNPSFSSPNITSSEEPVQTAAVEPTEQAVTSEELASIASTDAGAVAAAAAAMVEEDARPAVGTGAFNTSATSGSNNSASRSRFGLGGRKFKSSKNSTPATTAIAGAPSYFNEAMGDIILQQDDERKGSSRKKVAIIVIILLLLAAIAAAVFFIVLPALAPSNEELRKDLGKIISENYSGYAQYEDIVKEFTSSNVYLDRFIMSSEEAYNQYKNGTNESLEKVEKLQKALNDKKYSSISGINDAKDIINKKMEEYKRFDELTASLTEAVRSEDNNGIDEALKGYDGLVGIDTVSKVLKETVKARAEARDMLKKNSCDINPSTNVCIDAGLKRARANQALSVAVSVSPAFKEYVNATDSQKLTEFLKKGMYERPE